MFSVMQETDSGQHIWPGVSSVYTSKEEGERGLTGVTAILEKGGLLDFRVSKKKNNIYVMNETGATVARYYIGENPKAPENVPPDDSAACTKEPQQ